MQPHVGDLKRRAVVEEEDPFHDPDRFVDLELQQLLVLGVRRLCLNREERLVDRPPLRVLQVTEDGALHGLGCQGRQDFDGNVAGLDDHRLVIKDPQALDAVHKLGAVQEQVLLQFRTGGNHPVVQQLAVGLLPVDLEAIRDAQVVPLVAKGRLVLQVQGVDERPRPALLEHDALVDQDAHGALDGAATDLVAVAETALIR